MRRVSEKDYRKFIMWAKNNTANNVYPCSIAEYCAEMRICSGQDNYRDSEKEYGLSKDESDGDSDCSMWK